MSARFWVATTAGRKATGDQPQTRTVPPPDLQDRCRDGAIIVAARGWLTEVFVDPTALSHQPSWRDALQASMPGHGATAADDPRPGVTGTEIVLSVLCSATWERSTHSSLSALLEEIAAWITLHRQSLPRSVSIPAGTLSGSPHGVRHGGDPHDVPHDAPHGSAVADPRARELLAVLADATVSSAADIPALLPFSAGTIEAMLFVLNPQAPGPVLAIDHLDIHGSDGAIARLGLPTLYSWVLEVHLRRHCLVVEMDPQQPTGSPMVALAPVAFNTSDCQIIPAVAAIFASVSLRDSSI